MTYIEVLDKLNLGVVSYDIYMNQIINYGHLPTIPREFFLPIAGIDIIDDITCKLVLEALKEENQRIDNEYSKDEQNQIQNEEYDIDCFFVSLTAGQIFDFWFGKHNYIKDRNNRLAASIDNFLFSFWNYLREEITYDALKESGKNLYDTYEKIKNGGDLK